jgi:predicted permease
MHALAADLRYAIRTMLRTPGWTTMAVLTLALGTGTNTAVFSFVDSLLFRPAPGVRAPGRVVTVFTSDFSSGPYGDTSYPDYVSIAEAVAAFESVAAENDAGIVPVRIADDVQRARISQVTGGYFPLLGLTPSLGRAIADEDALAEQRVVVVSERFWKRALGGRSSALGSTIRVNDSPYTIVGVGPAAFRGMNLNRAVDLWTPLAAPENTPDARGNRGLSIVARLRDGARITDAQQQLTALAGRLAQEYPKTNLGTLDRPRDPRPMIVTAATRIGPEFRGQVFSLAAVLMGGVGLVLLLACANVASLLLSRSTTRVRELAVRRALGAGSGRVARQLLTETGVLTFAAAGVGLLVAAWTTEILPSFFPAEQAGLLDTTIGWHVLLYALVLASASSLIVGMLPAVRSLKTPLAAALRGHGDISDRAGSRMRNALVSVQVGIACVLLVAAGLLVQSVSHTIHADLGFATRDALLASVEVPSTWKKPAIDAYYGAARERIAALPGVESAAWVRALALARTARRGFLPEGYTYAPGEDRELNINYASAGYFETLRIPLRQGRTFTAADATGPKVIVVNETLAKKFFGGDAVGKRMTDSSRTVLEIVGVVGDTKYLTVADAPPPLVYYPVEQSAILRLTLVARTRMAPEQLADTVRRELRQMNGDVAVFPPRTLRAYVEEALGSERLTASLVALCGLLALALAVVGLYGAIAYIVTRRTREIGVRIALGATPENVLLLVVRQGLWIAGAGIAVGMIAAALAAQAVPLGLYGVTPLDPRTYAAVMVVLTLTAALAALLPAIRAIRIDPARALTHD